MYIFEHRRLVAEILKSILADLMRRAIVHDGSKFTTEEQLLLTSRKIDVTDPDYQANLARLANVLKHHYERNDHHPEHFKNGIIGMNLLQLIEMVADWQACCEFNETNIDEMLRIQQARFNIGDDLMSILRNTFTVLASLRDGRKRNEDKYI